MKSIAVCGVVAVLGSLGLPASALADSFVVMHDDGTLAKSTATPAAIEKEILAAYATTGLELPTVLSVWTTFPMMGNNYATFIDPLGNDVDGIGIPKSPYAKTLHAITLHNNVLVMADRAAKARAPLEGYSSYLFLLEFMHQWGPAVTAPAPVNGDLEGSPYHWSFFLESASPDGGNTWHDNGDGTFTVVPRAPKDVTYSMLDLYLMGLAAPSEITPFGVLTNVTVPATPTDPLWGGAFAGHSFPWFDPTTPPLTVKATRELVTGDQIVATNGTRSPAPAASGAFKVGIVLVVPANATNADVASASAVFAPMADDLAPSFQRATSGRGTLDVVTTSTPMGAGGAGGSGATSASSTAAGGHVASPKTQSGGCAIGDRNSSGTASLWQWGAGLLVIGAARRRRNRQR